MKSIYFLSLFSVLFLAACSAPAPVDVKLDKFNLTIAVPETDKTPEFKESSLDGKIGYYRMYIGEPRVQISEIESSIYPADLETIATVVSEGDDFKGFVDGENHAGGKVKLANGVFGVIFEDTKGRKNYMLYYTKDSRYFRMEPVLNNDLDGLQEQLTAYGTIK